MIKMVIALILLYMAVANYCNFKIAMGFPTTYCDTK